jgi:hypothetical protein
MKMRVALMAKMKCIGSADVNQTRDRAEHHGPDIRQRKKTSVEVCDADQNGRSD